MALLTDTWYVAKRELIKFLRTKVRVVVTLVQPILWLGLMGNMMGKVFDNPYVA
ncbi:MAG TPA: ABC transporter, partial [Candidatus Acetothermia bacterium]|nr:ABC transporter [Candidatus Acetothermia bacterium]